MQKKKKKILECGVPDPDDNCNNARVSGCQCVCIMLSRRYDTAGNSRTPKGYSHSHTHAAKWTTFYLNFSLSVRTRGSRSALHGGRELEVGDANVVVAAVEEDVGLRGRAEG